MIFLTRLNICKFTLSIFLILIDNVEEPNEL